MSFQFEWDNDKPSKNIIKHGISFDEASTVFDDELSFTKEKNMKKVDKKEASDDFMREEYDIDYSKGVRGKYARKATEENGYIKLSPELQKIVKTSEDVNNALKSVIEAILKTGKRTSLTI
jgi:hypothetical protein